MNLVSLGRRAIRGEALVLVISLVAIILMIYWTTMNSEQSCKEYVFGVSFRDILDKRNYIVYSIAFGIFANVPIAIEMILDLFTSSFNDATISVNTNRENFFILVFNCLPGGLLIIMRSSENFPFYLLYLVCVQYYGLFEEILSICHKYAPTYYSNNTITIMKFSAALGTIIFMSIRCPSSTQYSNIIQGIIYLYVTLSFLSIFLHMIRNECRNFQPMDYQSISTWKIFTKISFNGNNCIVYVILTISLLFIIPAITLFINILHDGHPNTSFIITIIYCMFSLSLVPSFVRSQTLKYYLKLSESKLFDEQSTKRASLNHLSHEMRTPLNTICNGIDFLINDISTHCSSTILHDIKDIKLAAYEAVALLDDFMNLEKLETGSLNVFPKLVSVTDIISSMIQPLGEYANQKEQIFVMPCNIPSEDISINVDKHKLGQVFRTLITNAVRFTPVYGRVSVDVRIETDGLSNEPVPLREIDHMVNTMKTIRNSFVGGSIRRSILAMTPTVFADDNGIPSRRSSECNVYVRIGTVVFEITDTGCGTPEHIRSQVFGQNFRFDPLKQGGGGSGMGLWICKEIIQRLGGSIVCNSGPDGKGTVFSIRLDAFRQPYKQKEDTKLNQLASMQHSIRRAFSGSLRISQNSTRVSPQAAQTLNSAQNSFRNSQRLIKSYSQSGMCNSNNKSMDSLLEYKTADFDDVLTRNADSLPERDAVSHVTIDVKEMTPYTKDSRNEKNSRSCVLSSINMYDCHPFETSVADQNNNNHSVNDVIPATMVCNRFNESTQSVSDTLQLSVLVVDDSDLNRRIVIKVLQRAVDSFGYAIELDITEANDGIPAHEAMSLAIKIKRPYDLVLMDNIMLQMNGPEATRIMRCDGYTGLVIAVTGNVMTADVKEFLASGANSVLKKPVSVDTMRGAIGEEITALIDRHKKYDLSKV